jgi:hypothetical protein
MLTFHPPDIIEQHLSRLYPEHVHGYRSGWLRTEKVKEYNAIHVYTRDDAWSPWQILTTVLY